MSEEKKQESLNQQTAEAQETAEVQETTDQTEAQVEMPESSEAVIASLQTELANKEKAMQESNDRVKRLQADFDNFRRRTRQEKEELSTVVAQSLIKDLLPLLDNFERALATEIGPSPFKEGVEMIYKQFMTTLEKNGLESIQAVGEKFDPNFHEAIMRVADESKEDDTVAEELQRGYSIHGRVIRPSMVKVVGN